MNRNSGLVSSRLDRSRFHHKYGRGLRDTCLVQYSFGYSKSLTWAKCNRFILELNNKFAFEYEEKLVFLIMLMPVKLSLFEYANTNDTIIYLARVSD